MNKIALTAIVTAFPPDLHFPRPLPGETPAQMVIRNHPQEWRNCIARLRKDFAVPEDVCSRLLKGEVSAAVDSVAQSEINRFMHLRLPSHGRTLQGLADLRDEMQKPGGLGQLWQLQLSEIILPRQKNPSGDTELAQFAASLGVILVSIETEEPRPLELSKLLKYIHGDYVWILPGGSMVDLLIMMSLIRVLRGFQENPKLALYSDGCYCVIFRTSALRVLTAAGKTLSGDVRDTARMLQEAGFELTADKDPIHSLVEIESVYGGQHDPFSQMPSNRGAAPRFGKQSWWRSLLRLD